MVNAHQKIRAPIDLIDLRSGDGTRIRAYRCGEGPHRWLLPPGLGTPLYTWKPLLEHFKQKMTIVTWDLRGCYGSGPPVEASRNEVSDHIEDAMAVVDTLGWSEDPLVTGGWSMGVELGLEIYARLSDRVRGLVLINGAFEHVLRTAFGTFPYAESLLVLAIEAMIDLGPILTPLSRFLLGRPSTFRLLRHAGIVASNEDFFLDVVREFRQLDFGSYLPMILALNRHSARHIMPTVDVPTLITAGDADPMTPLSIARQTHAAIQGSELVVFPGGTHYTPIEFPERLCQHLERFFRTKVFADSWPN